MKAIRSMGGFSGERSHLLFRLCENSDFERVKSLCESGTSVRQRNANGKTCLMIPDFFTSWNSERSLPIFKYLIQKGLSVEEKTVTGHTALHFAVENRNVHLVKLLTAEGARNCPDENGETPLMKAALLSSDYGSILQTESAPEIFNHLMNYVRDEKEKNEAKLIRAAVTYLEMPDVMSLDGFKSELTAANKSKQKISAKKRVKTNPAYDSLREAHSLKDFETAKNLKRFATMQCFIVLERILNERSPGLRNTLLRYVELSNITVFSGYAALIRHTISLYQRYGDPLSDSLFAMIEKVYQWVTGWEFHCPAVDEKDPPPQVVEMAEYLFDQICCALEEAQKEGFTSCSRNSECIRFVLLAVNLFLKVDHFGIKITDNDGLKRLGFDETRFAKVVTLLHVPLFHLNPIFDYPYLIPFFVRAGANINEKEENGNTALSEHFFKSQNRRQFHRDLQRELKIKQLDIFGKLVRLKDICAGVVEKNYSPEYLAEVLTQNLQEYLSIHNDNYSDYRSPSSSSEFSSLTFLL
ncbi:unnamed protein product [Caenorhabditis auriculariae]|uniref:Uncharacterized protein n=1 Tax=Caenorhabditis auriculariae TaxID=2777116 RepID=A0A8S1H1Q6_9PELO|nr:unnamed protein product [Caenorhabditis auriculariae]